MGSLNEKQASYAREQKALNERLGEIFQKKMEKMYENYIPIQEHETAMENLKAKHFALKKEAILNLREKHMKDDSSPMW